MSNSNVPFTFKFSLWGLFIATTVAAVIVMLSLNVPETHWVHAPPSKIKIEQMAIWVGELHPPTRENSIFRMTVGLSVEAIVFFFICYREERPFDLVKIDRGSR
jgi:hypothetical protein